LLYSVLIFGGDGCGLMNAVAGCSPREAVGG